MVSLLNDRKVSKILISMKGWSQLHNEAGKGMSGERGAGIREGGKGYNI